MALRKKATARKAAKKAPAKKKVTKKRATKRTSSKTASRKKMAPPRKRKSVFKKILTAEGWKRLMTGAKK